MRLRNASARLRRAIVVGILRLDSLRTTIHWECHARWATLVVRLTLTPLVLDIGTHGR